MKFFLRHTGNDHVLAQDLTQDTLWHVIAGQRLHRIERPESYVFTVATNLLRNRKRLQANGGLQTFVPIEAAIANELEQQPVEDLSAQHVLLTGDSLEEVRRTLDELGERTRDIFVLFRLERMKQKDIAALYGIAQSTVEKHVMRATMHLAAWYGGRKRS